MLPTVLRSILTNVLGVLNKGASLSITSATNKTPTVDECMSLDPRYKIDQTKCSLAPTINWHLGCYQQEYQYVIKLPMIQKTVEDRDFCKSLVDKLCGEMVNKEMREDEIKEGDNRLSGNQVDLNYACSTQVCGNNYVCVMLCSHHLLAMCHITHYSLTTSPSSNVSSSIASCSSPDKHGTIHPENISTNSNIVSDPDSISRKSKPNFKLTDSLNPASDNKTEVEKQVLQAENDAITPKSDSTEPFDATENTDSNTESDEQGNKEVSGTKEPDSKPGNNSFLEANKEKNKKTKETKESDPDHPKSGNRERKAGGGEGKRGGDGAGVEGYGGKNGDSKNGSPLPTVDQDHQDVKHKESNGHATPPNKESVVVRLSNKIKVKALHSKCY